MTFIRSGLYLCVVTKCPYFCRLSYSPTPWSMECTNRQSVAHSRLPMKHTGTFRNVPIQPFQEWWKPCQVKVYYMGSENGCLHYDL